MKQILEKMLERSNLTQHEMSDAFDKIMTGNMTPVQISAFITALRMKGESVDELAGAASSMRRHAVLIDAGGRQVVDTCGTGGDRMNSFNVSTCAAIVTAGSGVPVAKHGNRAVSSQCGSADVLAELGVNIEAPPEVVEECIQTIGIGFLYAPKLHPAMKHAVGVRRELGIRTIFNMLGPLTNPAGARGQILGVFSPELTEPFARVLQTLGSNRAFIVHGHDGIDEISVTTTTRITELCKGVIRTYEFDPLTLIEEYYQAEDIAGADPAFNADVIRRVLSGKKGAYRDITLINAGAAIAAGGKADSIEAGFELAQESVDTGKASDTLSKLIENTK